MANARGRLDVDARPTRWARAGVMDGRPIVLLSHGAGAGMDSTFQVAAAAGLVERGLVVARFDFPYMEQARVQDKRRPPDRQPVLLATWRAMLAAARRWKPGAPLVMAGKSMGGRVASLVLAGEDGPPPEDVVAAVYLGYPLHPAGRPERLRDAHLPAVAVPQLFVQGSRDALCDPALLAPVLKRLGGRARHHAVEGGDHSLALRRSAPLLGSEGWLDAVAAFVHGSAASAR